MAKVWAASFLISSSLFGSASSYYYAKPSVEKPAALQEEERNTDPFHIDVGFILEQARVSLIPYAVSTTANTNSKGIFYPDVDLSVGLTCGLGYDFGHDDWAATAQLDWLKSTERGAATKPANATLTSTHFNITTITGNAPNSAENASSTVDIDYFSLRLSLGRIASLKNAIRLSSNAGLKLAFIYGDKTNIYTGGGIATNEVITETATTDCWGIGPNVGMTMNWFFVKNLGLLFDLNIAMLVSYVTVTGDLSYSAHSPPSLTNLAYTVPTFTSSIRNFLGLIYEQKIFSGSQSLFAKIGWDTTMYSSQFFLLMTGDTGSTDGLNFGLTGLLFDVGWSF